MSVVHVVPVGFTTARIIIRTRLLNCAVLSWFSAPRPTRHCAEHNRADDLNDSGRELQNKADLVDLDIFLVQGSLLKYG